MTRRIVLIAGVLVAVIAGAFYIDGLREFREAVTRDPRAKSIVSSTTPSGDTERREWARYILREVVPAQTNPVTAFLVRQRPSVLWLFQYALAGIAGGSIYLLILLIDPKIMGRDPATALAESEPGRLFGRLLLAGAAGVLTGFAVRLPASLAFGALRLPATGMLSQSDAYSSLLLFPLAAGTFSSTFYAKLHLWLERILSKDK
jgi:hypothetical protein